MQMIADLHTHTLCATHAYNTFTEMAAAAKEIGYCALAVTDHAPAMPDSPHAWHFQNWSAMPTMTTTLSRRHLPEITRSWS